MTQNIELAKVKAKIRALVAKTTDNGASEAEAMSAMTKVGELLETFNLSMGDVSEVREEACDTGDFQTYSKHAGIASDVAVAVAAFTNTKAWLTREINGVVIKFFGVETDVELAKYITSVITSCFEGEYKTFKESETYKNYNGHRRVLNTDFRRGFAGRINDRLYELKANATKEYSNNTGTALVVVEKDKYVQEEFDKLNMRLRKTYRQTRYVRSGGAYSAGASAGNKVNLNRPVGTNSNSTKQITG